MAEEMLRGKLDRAFDPGADFPDRLLMSRTMAMLDAEAVSRGLEQRGRGSRFSATWPLLGLRIAAVAMVVVLALAAVALFLATHQPVGPTPVHQVPPPVTGDATVPILGESSQFLTSDEGAVVTQRGLLITHDGGRQWQLILTLDWTNRNEFRFVGNGQIIVVSTSTKGSQLLHSTADGGAHWQTVHIAPISQPYVYPAQFFLNAREGWQEIDSQNLQLPPGSFFVYHTTDGGAHWTKLWSGQTLAAGPNPILDGSPISLVFTDSTHGYMGAFSSSGAAQLYVTRDGGRTWKIALLPLPPGGWGGECCAKGFMTSPQVTMFGNRGFAVEGDYVRSAVYETTDGGQTWGNPRLIPTRTSHAFFHDPDHWWVTGWPNLFETVDAGATWREIPVQVPQGAELLLDGLSPTNTQILWGIAFGPVPGVADSACYQALDGYDCAFLIRSTDGGAHWADVKLPST